MRALTKKQRNALYDQIVTAGLDPARCDFGDDEQDVRLTHGPTGSLFSAQLHKYEGYTVRKASETSLLSSFSSRPGQPW
jgi:hypothetical protein